ncbi:MAG: hypothetical protein ACYC77_02455 [Coriobacteriia bacterium]
MFRRRRKRMSLSDAARWFALPHLVDEVGAPTKWVFGLTDIEANDVLNDYFASQIGIQAGPPVSEWTHVRERRLPGPTCNYVGWTPCYFPDAQPDFALVTAKHLLVSRAFIASVEYLEKVSRDLWGTVGERPVQEAENPDFFVCPSQFKHCHLWIVRSVPEYSTDPELRRSWFFQHYSDTFTDDARHAATVFDSGAVVHRAERVSAEFVLKTLMGTCFQGIR